MIDKIKKYFDKFITSGLAAIGGMFWRMGGSRNYSRYWRRAGVAGLLVINCLIKTKSLFSLFIFPLAFGAFSLGYGLPSSTDKGSFIGRFWNKYIKDENKLRFMTRLTVGFCYSLNYIILGLLKSHYLRMSFAMLSLSLIIPLICALRLEAIKEESLIGVSIILLTQII